MNISFPPTTARCRYCSGTRTTSCYWANCNKYENQTAAACFTLDSKNCEPGPMFGVILFYIILGAGGVLLCMFIASIMETKNGTYETSTISRINSRVRLNNSMRSLSLRVVSPPKPRQEEIPTVEVVLT